MADIIQLLPDAIANQIAAGEVVQRPASAVKELMENALDARATQIQLIVREAGKALIQVIDNGQGMSETDARMSLERHATSKIRSAEDLFTIRTMGFRGEALASIAAVSQLEMKTRRADDELGTLLLVEGSEVKAQEPAACEVGTSISVRNLFYNIPARRNFLKSNPVELKHIIDEFQRLALAHPEVTFKMIQGDDTVYDLAPARLPQRIVALFGKSYQEQLAQCQEETDSIRVSGYIGRPEAARKTRGEQFLFVNKRFIRSNYLNHAVTSAFEGLLAEGNYPFYALFIEIDPRHIDVNVHPTKTEIKFDDERAVYAVVRASVRQALGAHNLTPALDFHADVNMVSKLNQTTALNREDYFNERLGTTLQRENLRNWEQLFESPTNSKLLQRQDEAAQDLHFESAVNVPVNSPEPERILFQLQNRWVVRSVRAGLMFIDQQAAHERVLFDRYAQLLKASRGASQQCLFPQTIDFSPADFTLVMEMEPELSALGFRLEVFGKNTLLIQGVPAEAAGREKDLFAGFLEQFKRNQSELHLPIKENLARSLARRAAMKSGQKLEREEMESLVERLFASSNPNFAPDGRTTFYIFDTSKMESYFR
ncbi:MAG: DNA mismatch repair endonuclease MutL [Cyclobacteriaceae bacterium]|nr:DNA mismatch repair endonuclease MutL [Cyclobacteriaceae bacterium]